MKCSIVEIAAFFCLNAEAISHMYVTLKRPITSTTNPNINSERHFYGFAQTRCVDDSYSVMKRESKLNTNESNNKNTSTKPFTWALSVVAANVRANIGTNG